MENGIKVNVTGYLKGSSTIDSKYVKIVLSLLYDNQFEFDEVYLEEDDEFDEDEIEEINSILKHVQEYDYEKYDFNDYEFDAEGDIKLELCNHRYVSDDVLFDFEYDFDEYNNLLIFDARFKYDYILDYTYKTYFDTLDETNLFEKGRLTTGLIENDGEFVDECGNSFEEYVYVKIDKDYTITEIEETDDYYETTIEELIKGFENLKEGFENFKDEFTFEKNYRVKLINRILS